MPRFLNDVNPSFDNGKTNGLKAWPWVECGSLVDKQCDCNKSEDVTEFLADRRRYWEGQGYKVTIPDKDKTLPGPFILKAWIYGCGGCVEGNCGWRNTYRLYISDKDTPDPVKNKSNWLWLIVIGVVAFFVLKQ